MCRENRNDLGLGAEKQLVEYIEDSEEPDYVVYITTIHNIRYVTLVWTSTCCAHSFSLIPQYYWYAFELIRLLSQSTLTTLNVWQVWRNSNRPFAPDQPMPRLGTLQLDLVAPLVPFVDKSTALCLSGALLRLYFHSTCSPRRVTQLSINVVFKKPIIR